MSNQIFKVGIPLVILMVLLAGCLSEDDGDSTVTDKQTYLVSGVISLDRDALEIEIRFGVFNPTQIPENITLVIENDSAGSSVYIYDVSRDEWTLDGVDGANLGGSLVWVTMDTEEINAGDKVFFPYYYGTDYTVSVYIDSEEISRSDI